MRLAESTVIQGTTTKELEVALTREIEPVITPVSELSLTGAGALRVDSREVYMTPYFARRLAGMSGIPSRYALESPGDISDVNFNYWLPKVPGSIKVILVNGVAAGVVPADFTPLPLPRLVEELPLDKFPLARFMYDGLGLELGLVTDRITVEPNKGDIVKVGLSLTASDLFKSRVEVEGLLYRLACLNGATVATPFMTRKYQRALWQTPDAVLRGLGEIFTQTVARVKEVAQNLKILKDTEVTFENQEEGEERLGNLLREGRIPRRYATDLYLAFQPEEATAYGLYNAVTRMGRDARERAVRGKYELLGGRLVVETEDLIGLVVPGEEFVVTGQG